MSSHKNKEHLMSIKNAVNKTNSLSDEEKSDSVKRIEEWILEDKAFGTIKEELLEINVYFKELFSELGFK
ncbi:MAG: hypothetical protein ABFQ64_01560 [Campylobacterota bacterium]